MQFAYSDCLINITNSILFSISPRLTELLLQLDTDVQIADPPVVKEKTIGRRHEDSLEKDMGQLLYRLNKSQNSQKAKNYIAQYV